MDRLFTGIVQMRYDRAGSVDLHNEVWTSWAPSLEAAIGMWIEKSTQKHPGAFMSYHGCYDVTDVALQQLRLPA